MTSRQVATLELDKEESERLVRELVARNKKLSDDAVAATAELESLRRAAESARRNAADAASGAEIAGLEKAALDKDWERKSRVVVEEHESSIRVGVGFARPWVCDVAMYAFANAFERR